jgi:hypothetical protein
MMYAVEMDSQVARYMYQIPGRFIRPFKYQYGQYRKNLRGSLSLFE